MTDHKKVIVPLESWCYASPHLRFNGRSIDIGLFAEALIYYDTVFVNLTNQLQFAEFLQWFERQNRLSDLMSLIEDGTIKIYDYSFATTAILKDDSDTIWNVQDEMQAKPDTFEQRYLYHPSVELVLPRKARHRSKFYNILRGNVVEAKAESFGKAVKNARQDYRDARRSGLIVQAFVDELYRFRHLGHPPEVSANVATSANGTTHRIQWNVEFSELTALAGPKLNFHPGTPLTAGAQSNRLIWSAAQMDSDVFLPEPMSKLVGDKLYESAQRVAKIGNVIEELNRAVEFPDIRKLVNDEQLTLADVLKIRKKAKRFRDWLQSEADRDRDAIIAYHNEVAKQAGFNRAARRSLNMFGIIGGGATAAYIGAVVGGMAGTVLGGAAGSGAGYLVQVASRIGENWRPVMFGEWLRGRIQEIIDNE